MHVGHQELFKALGDEGAILVIDAGYANLTPGASRSQHSDLPIIFYPLDEIRHLDAKGFVEKLSQEFPDLKKIVVGYDFHFGKDRSYDYDDLKALFNGDVEVIGEVKVDDDAVHSHKIRAKLQIGDIHGANRFLGYNYTIIGRHVKGQGLGEKELFATINIDAKGYLLPKEGVYVTTVRLGGEEHYHPAVTFIGHRLTTDGSFAVETHILDGEVGEVDELRISFVDHIRDNQKFDDLQQLKKAIAEDIKSAERRLKRLSL